MIERIVRFVLKAPGFAVVFALLLVGVGLNSYSDLNIEAYPNPVPPMVEVIAQPPGWSAEETERYVTIPLEIGLAGMPGLDHVRSQSLFGLADVKCYFNWGTSYKDARQEVINRLQFIQLPGGVQAQISPWNAIGEIFRYRLIDRNFEEKKKQLEKQVPYPADQIRELRDQSLLRLKTLEDWVLERQWKQVP